MKRDIFYINYSHDCVTSAQRLKNIAADKPDPASVALWGLVIVLTIAFWWVVLGFIY